MVRPDVVQYLRLNLGAFPVEDLRRQLLSEGVPEADLEDSLTEALQAKPAAAAGAGAVRKRLALIGVAVALAAGGALIALSGKPKPASEGNTPAGTGESGYVGHRGWVVRLPKDYTGVSEFRDERKTHQIVYFCKSDTDPTNFLNEGLYGQLGIVKLEVLPSDFPNNPTGLASLARLATEKYNRSGEKFVMKNIQVGSLSGIQVNVQSPYPRVEAYVLGEQDLYFFYGGQEDDVWRDIVLSLRDAHTEG